MKQLEGETMDEQAQALLDRLVPELADLQNKQPRLTGRRPQPVRSDSSNNIASWKNSTDKSSQTKNCSHD